MSGCIPAVVSSVERSSARGTSGAEGLKTWPLDSKNARYAARSSPDVRILRLYESVHTVPAGLRSGRPALRGAAPKADRQHHRDEIVMARRSRAGFRRA